MRGVTDGWVWRRLPEIYLVVGLVVGLALCLITPPFFVPDEPTHAKRAIGIGHGRLIAEGRNEASGGWVDSGALDAMHVMSLIDQGIGERYPVARDRPDGRMSEAQMDSLRGLRWSGHAVYAPYQNTAVYPPLLYLPQAVGWRLGEGLGWTILHSLELARMLNVLVSTLLGWLALRLSVTGRWMLWAYLLLPTGLSLRASCSQDALLLALTALLGAMLLRAVTARRALTALELTGVTLLLIVVIGARIPYLPLAVVVALPYLNQEKLTLPGLRGPALAMVAIVLAVSAWQVSTRPFGSYVAPGANPAQQVSYLKTHPVSGAFRVVAGTVRVLPGLAVKGMEVLGVNDVYPSLPVYGLLLLTVGAIVVFGGCAGLTTRWSRLLLVAVMLTITAGMSLAEYVIWNPPGSSKVDGLQSRYFIALLPLCLLLRRSERRDWVERWRVQGRLAAGALLLLLVAYTPWLVAQRYFRMNPVVVAWAALR